MEPWKPNAITTKQCPACGATDYEFRGRKKIAAEAGRSEGEKVETRSRCKACGEGWRVTTSANGAT